jgi:hypothetical protein
LPTGDVEDKANGLGQMSVWNAAIAFVEGRYELAREFLRRGSSSPGELQSRLHSALEKREKQAVEKALRAVLLEALKLKPPDPTNPALSPDEAFYAGVEAVEKLIEARPEIRDLL